MFASNLHRIQQVVDNCIEFERKICFVGRSMVNVTKLAMEIGELKIPQDVFIDVGDLDCYADSEIVVLTTGSQGGADERPDPHGQQRTPQIADSPG